MTIKEVVKKFNEGSTRGQASEGRVRIEGDVLYNYNTIIAIRTTEGIKLNVKKYSRTTSKLQTLLKVYCNIIEEYEGPDAYILYGW